MNKGDLPLMYSCVFWCEFIDLLVFFGCYCLTPAPLFIIRSKGSTEKQPAVRTLSTRRRFAVWKPIESQIFSTRGKLLSSLHRSKGLKAKYLHACCWKWTFPRAVSKIPYFSRRLDTAPGHGTLAPRSNFPRPRVAQSTKKTPQQTFPVVIQILSILKFFVYCCHSDIDFTKNCILTNFIS